MSELARSYLSQTSCVPKNADGNDHHIGLIRFGASISWVSWLGTLRIVTLPAKPLASAIKLVGIFRASNEKDSKGELGQWVCSSACIDAMAFSTSNASASDRLRCT